MAKESEKNVPVSQEVTDRGLAVFEDNEKFQLWLNTACRALGDKKPIECSEAEILQILGRIEHGVYS